MMYCTGGDVSLFLDDLFQNKFSLVSPTKSFQIYQAPLAERRTRLASLYEKAVSSREIEISRTRPASGRSGHRRSRNL